MPGVQVYYKVFVWRVRVHANDGLEAPTRQRRYILGQVLAHESDLFIAHLPVERFGGARHAAGAEKNRLYAALSRQKREAGERVAVVRFPDEDGKVIREKWFCTTLGLEPVNYPPLGLQGKTQVREQFRGPGTSRDNTSFRLVCGRRR